MRRKGGDRQRLRLASDRSAVLADFHDAAAAARATCGTTATPQALEADLDGLVDEVVYATTVSPGRRRPGLHGDHPRRPRSSTSARSSSPICSRGTPYVFFVKRGTVNKLLIYYQGGGACWDYLTCSAPDLRRRRRPGRATTRTTPTPASPTCTNPRNPVPGLERRLRLLLQLRHPLRRRGAGLLQLIRDTLHVEHRGYQTRASARSGRASTSCSPEEIFVTGSSAGAYGAWFNAPLHGRVWPASHVRRCSADAGNGVITQDFLDERLPELELRGEPARRGSRRSRDAHRRCTGILALHRGRRATSRGTRLAHYTTAYDGGTGGQTGFYNVMLNDGNPRRWPSPGGTRAASGTP